MPQSVDAETEEMERVFAEVRQRFIGSLARRMTNIAAAFAVALGDTDTAVEGVKSGYGELHNVCGMAGLVGFDDLGRMARVALNHLSQARREKRGLLPAEARQFEMAYRRLKAGMEAAAL